MSNSAKPPVMHGGTPIFRLRKHSDYQRVYAAGRKQHAKQMSYFFALRPGTGADGGVLRHATPGVPRVGLTVGKVLGKAVDRNRIKRRLREAVRHHLHLLPLEVDVILHPRRSVLDLPFGEIAREISVVFRNVERMARRSPAPVEAGERPRATS